jgi:hypothetical protein
MKENSEKKKRENNGERKKRQNNWIPKVKKDLHFFEVLLSGLCGANRVGGQSPSLMV